ncbi:uncharacterized protein PHACADRAFT_141759 [Phanerochaete carnosa HHB-10118-sp]|uniref:Sacsin/Nov domain-containing protein n=1 Tax=Phanerochaete carnosa (strain HHB-10118-sp) TaxID=650164 RepID=K5X233_PHACS|nr:uncharacterized protein PHACADRAFT_141759 [Phanerochaete carnosa HHB-10118-sp]EKM56817.1 hypothetical protein PHACADRAFT_141759 [Phanerochaete carnosa HHB-10118-sp]
MAHARDALWASGHDESVEVNQRALIDKVLARYSGEFTVFRELLQNSDDASSKAVEIHFESKAHISMGGATEAQDAQGPGDGMPEKLRDLKTAVVHQWTFKNNGTTFQDEDWSRLKKIAEGNPDEEKIGAFGVGFYSLFSVTEEPFVTSGDQWMGFYWKGGKDQLFARRGNLPEGEHGQWTTFSMPLREPGPPPIPFDFIRFLASSITFMARLSEVSVFFDGRRLARLKKDRGIPRPIGLKKGLKTETIKGTMKVIGVDVMPLHIKAEVMQWIYEAGSSAKQRKRVVVGEQQQARRAVTSGFFSSLFSSFSSTPQRAPSPMLAPESEGVEREAEEQKKLLTVKELNVTLAVFSAEVEVRLDERMKKELLRATKKNPPTHMKYELIYTGKEEYDASKKEDEQSPLGTGSIFQGLRADIDGTGAARIFIGHSTGQTTGIGGHMSARFIPTVERESIDFMDRNVRVWNEELLGVGGYLARTAYEEEMYSISFLWPKSDLRAPNGVVEEEAQRKLSARALHAMKFFTFHASTPAAQASALLEEAFFSCVSVSSPFSFKMGEQSTHPFPVISTVGIRSTSEVRLPNPTFAEFLKQLPVLPAEVIEDAKTMIETLRARDMIKEITFTDVLKELRARPLPEAEMIACFKWWIDLYKSGATKQTERARGELLNAAVVIVCSPGGADERIIPLNTIKSFLNSRVAYIPLDGPLPSYLLPHSISRHFDSQWLKAAFGWDEFHLPEWLRHILDPQVRSSDAEHDITLSASWAERVLQVFTRAWPSSTKVVQQAVADLLKNVPCVPTITGMKLPSEVYFQNAHVFPDLPLVKLPSGAPIKGTLEKVLEALGVRKHVDLQIIFNRMIKTGDWSIIDLIKYLIAVQSTLSDDEIERLKLTAAFPKEQRAEVQKQPLNEPVKPERYRANQLYEPSDLFRKLALPVIDWGQNKWRPSSEEAKFLFRLGLLRSPPLQTLLGLATSSDEEIRSQALKYLLENHSTRYNAYNSADFADIAFIPALRDGRPCMAKPTEVFARRDWSVMGFPVASPTLSTEDLIKLGIRDHPPAMTLVNLLTTAPPQNEEIAKQWFTLMAGRITEFTPAQLQTLSQSLVVPVKSEDKPLRLMAPRQCYFRNRVETQQLHSKLFTFVDFGLTANQFLSACGTKREPTVEEVAQILLDNPRHFYTMAEGRDSFLAELRNIAVNRRLLSGGVSARMKRSPILLGIRRVKREKKREFDEADEEEDWDYEYDLLPAAKVVIADDTNAYQLFGDAVFSCPQEDLLEDFYQELGSRRLSSLIKDEHKPATEIKHSKKAQETRTLILERLPLFLHEHTHTQTRVPYSWLNQEKNFAVRTFGKLTVVKSLAYDQLQIIKNQDSSAIAFRDGRGPIQLWLAGNDAVDMYEVSTSLCRLLFEHPRASDALLFMTILSTDLKALKRRGYNVDRILQRQKAQRQAAEGLAREAEKMSHTALREPAVHDPPLPSLELPGQDDEVSLVSDSSTAILSQDGTRSTFRNSIDNWRKKLTGKSGPLLLGSTPEMQPASMRPSIEQGDGGGDALLPPSGPPISRPVTPSGPTPMHNIAANIDMAVRACREEKSEVFMSKTQEDIKVVKESISDSYCDASGQALDLAYVGDMGGIKFFFSRDVKHPKEVMARKREAIARFIHVIKPLGDVYGLPRSSLHIFYDLTSGTIAFNRNASIFCNLRFFEAWHDAQVDRGQMAEAYTSWYFTLAHEIAHNLVQPHNAEHEFWFSAVCERFIPAFTRLLASPSL